MYLNICLYIVNIVLRGIKVLTLILNVDFPYVDRFVLNIQLNG